MAEFEVVVGTNSLSALYYAGNYDVEISATIPRVDFSRDYRTSRPVIVWRSSGSGEESWRQRECWCHYLQKLAC